MHIRSSPGLHQDFQLEFFCAGITEDTSHLYLQKTFVDDFTHNNRSLIVPGIDR